MSPHSDDLDGLDVFQDLIDKAMLNVDPSRICAEEIAQELFEWRRVLKWIFTEDIQQPGGRGFKA